MLKHPRVAVAKGGPSQKKARKGVEVVAPMSRCSPPVERQEQEEEEAVQDLHPEDQGPYNLDRSRTCRLVYYRRKGYFAEQPAAEVTERAEVKVPT